jgi:hypothetical protein
VRLLLAIVVLSALATAPAQQPKASLRQCGFDRWPVKIWADKDAARVDLKPVDTTIRELGEIPIHEVPYPYDRRVEPEELKVYRVRARLVAIKLEKDSDLHLLLAEPEDDKVRMIAEAPAPECAEGTGHEELFRKVREQVGSLHRGDLVVVTGLGFFDFLHEQRGAAKNGIELHPIVSIEPYESRPSDFDVQKATMRR